MQLIVLILVEENVEGTKNETKFPTEGRNLDRFLRIFHLSEERKNRESHNRKFIVSSGGETKAQTCTKEQ